MLPYTLNEIYKFCYYLMFEFHLISNSRIIFHMDSIFIEIIKLMVSHFIASQFSFIRILAALCLYGKLLLLLTIYQLIFNGSYKKF